MYFKSEQRISGVKDLQSAEAAFIQWFLYFASGLLCASRAAGAAGLKNHGRFFKLVNYIILLYSIREGDDKELSKFFVKSCPPPYAKPKKYAKIEAL